MDCASRYVVHFKLFETNFYETSEDLAEELTNAIKSFEESPIILHSDSDFKNRAYSFFSKLFELGIFPSMNETIFGPMEEGHGNQVIEVFNRRFKSVFFKEVIKKPEYEQSDLQFLSITQKEQLIKQALKLYYNKPHTNLSTLAFNKKSGIPLSPAQGSEKDKQIIFCLKLVRSLIFKPGYPV